jgi:hypothetical protein
MPSLLKTSERQWEGSRSPVGFERKRFLTPYTPEGVSRPLRHAAAGTCSSGALDVTLLLFNYLSS